LILAAVAHFQIGTDSTVFEIFSYLPLEAVKPNLMTVILKKIKKAFFKQLLK